MQYSKSLGTRQNNRCEIVFKLERLKMIDMNKLVALFLGLLLSCTVLWGQSPKFGHINTNELITALPAMKEVTAKLEAEFKQKETQLTTMQEDLRKQQSDYQANASKLTPGERTAKEKQLGEMGQKVQNFYTLAQEQLKTKEQELKAPIIQKVRKAIQEVGDEKGFLYIFEISSGVAIFHSDKSVDVTPLVKTKLGVI